MTSIISYFLIPLLALLLVSAQAIWGSAIKNEHLIHGSPSKIASNLLGSPKIWTGAFVYICATLIYFVLLSRNKFFSVQVSMTAIAIIFSTILATVLFHEKLSVINVVGMCIVLIGLTLVLAY